MITGTNMVRQTSGDGTNYFISNVGIGTNDPSSKLHVVGNATVDGGLNVSGAMQIPKQGDVEMGSYTNGQPAGGSYSGSSSPPIGGVMAWCKNITGVPTLPGGWVECNGQTLSDTNSPLNGQVIPNLNGSNYFLRGDTASGTTGGEAAHVLTTNELPSHTHSAGSLVTATNTHYHSYSTKNATVNATGGALPNIWAGTASANSGNNSHIHDITGSVDASGGGAAHENRPPFYSVVWIMRVK